MRIRNVALRQFFSSVVLMSCALFAGAQAYPTKPIRIILPITPGGDRISSHVSSDRSSLWR